MGVKEGRLEKTARAELKQKAIEAQRGCTGNEPQDFGWGQRAVRHLSPVTVLLPALRSARGSHAIAHGEKIGPKIQV